MHDKKQIGAGPLEIGDRGPFLSRTKRSGDVVVLSGQFSMLGVASVTDGTIKDQTRAVLDDNSATSGGSDRTWDDVMKAMDGPRGRNDYLGFNAGFGECFPVKPPARPAVLSALLRDARVTAEGVACRSQEGQDQ